MGDQSCAERFQVGFRFRVNFHKTKVIGINVNHNFLLVAANFILCRIESKEFSFLGIPIGINPHRIKLCKFFVDNFRVRLAKWKGKFMSLGGIITLIKLVQSTLSIFLLYFYQAPSKI